MREALGIALSLVLLSAVAGEQPFAWRDTPIVRLEALALIQSLEVELLSHDSATLTLDHWCRDHHLAEAAQITAVPVPEGQKPPSTEQRARLGVSATETVRYRHVRLRCGEHVLSEAENWYVPSRLTPEMNRQLESTDLPFGRIVQPLHFQRHTEEATLLWSPLPHGWESASVPTPHAAGNAGPLEIPAQLIRHRARLLLPDGTPIAEVIETYSSQILAFPEPQLTGTPQPPHPP